MRRAFITAVVQDRQILRRLGSGEPELLTGTTSDRGGQAPALRAKNSISIDIKVLQTLGWLACFSIDIKVFQPLRNSAALRAKTGF